MRSHFSTRAWVMNTSANSALPVICFSGRTSTPGWRMEMRKQEMPLCLGTPGSVGRGAAPVGDEPAAGPDLLPRHLEVIALVLGPGPEARRIEPALGSGRAGTRAPRPW